MEMDRRDTEVFLCRVAWGAIRITSNWRELLIYDIRETSSYKRLYKNVEKVQCIVKSIIKQTVMNVKEINLKAEKVAFEIYNNCFKLIHFQYLDHFGLRRFKEYLSSCCSKLFHI